jgi:cytochrome c-type biogenesis protein CcmH/NrfG
MKPLHDPALHAWIMEDWSRLISIASDWVLADPSNVAAWRYLADGHFGMNAMDKAELVYRKVLELEETAVVWESLGETLLWQGIAHQLQSADELAAVDLDEALGCMQSALGLDAGYARVFGGIGMIRYHQQEPELARAALELHLGHYPQDARSWHYLGMVQADLGDDESAVSAFRAAVSLTVNPLSQLRNWLLLRESATRIGRDDLVREANENLYRMASLIRDRQANDQVTSIASNEE